MFASGLLLHLTTAAVAGAILARLGRSPAWAAAAVLFHPTLYRSTAGRSWPTPARSLGLLLAAWAVVSDRASRLAGV